jgi:Tol biopolymer transport system component
MSDTREILRRGLGDYEPPIDRYESVLKRRDRRRRNQRIAAGVVAAAIGVAAVLLTTRTLTEHDPHLPGGRGTPVTHEDDTYLLTISDGTLTPFRSPIDGWSYRFSPDGSKVAFVATNGGAQRIFRMNADGTGVAPLTTSSFLQEWAVDVDEPAWSPDGDWLVISGTDVRNGQRSLYFLSAGVHPQTGTNAPPRAGFGSTHPASQPTWSPDGRDIAFTETGDGGSTIQIVRTSRYFGGKSITTAGSPHQILAGASSFSWSIDGTRIVFVSSDTGLVSTADVDRTDVLAVTDLRSANPSWSPDGASIAYDDLSSGRIAIYNVVTTETRYLDVGACAQGWADASTLLVTTECDR